MVSFFSKRTSPLVIMLSCDFKKEGSHTRAKIATLLVHLRLGQSRDSRPHWRTMERWNDARWKLGGGKLHPPDLNWILLMSIKRITKCLREISEKEMTRLFWSHQKGSTQSLEMRPRARLSQSRCSIIARLFIPLTSSHWDLDMFLNVPSKKALIFNLFFF